MSVDKAHLQAENKSLKVDLQKALDSRDGPRKTRSMSLLICFSYLQKYTLN